MSPTVGLGWFTLLTALANIDAQKTASVNINSQCQGNILRVDVAPLGGKLLEVAAVVNNSIIILTPSLASQCGFSIKTHLPGRAVIYASLLNCFAHNVDDKAFTTTLYLRLHGNNVVEDEFYQVGKTCHYAPRTFREIICDHGYMEVSVRREAPGDYDLPQQPISGPISKLGDPQRAAEKFPIDEGFRITTLVFFTPVEKMMTVAEAQESGYGIANTATRLLLRSPTSTPETYTQNVAGVTMTVLRASAIVEKKWLVTQIDAAAACPTLEGSVFFSQDSIRWFLPWHIDPLISSGPFKLLEVHAGVDGMRLESAKVAASQYSLTVGEAHVILEIPVGAAGGYFKSHIRDNYHFASFTIEPMLELLWTQTQESTRQYTRYKVLLPITTPLMPLSPQVTDVTIPEQRLFKVLLRPLGLNVALVNITFPSEVLSVADCSIRGFEVLEHMSPNSSTKYFSLQVPFQDRVVQKTKELGRTIFSLHLTFGLLVLPEFAPFSLSAHLEIVPPSVSVECDYQRFLVLVTYGTHSTFQIVVGGQILTSGLAKKFGLSKNKTHLSFAVPFSSSYVVSEAIQRSFIKSRLDVALRNSKTNKTIQEFSLACDYFTSLTECFPNGTIMARAMKLESVPSLNPSLLVLRDPACVPSYSDNRSALFVFTANSCGTSRRFVNNMMLYENEISLPDELELKSEGPDYELKVSCYYDVNETHAVAFQSRPHKGEPYVDNARGQLQVSIRLAMDDSYSTFYGMEDYPVAKYLQEPLYFEVELMRSTNPEVSLELENCWATLDTDRTSRPRWNLIINGCANPVDNYQVIFHPVWVDSRVQYPSHFKRFEVKMFAFAEDEDNLSGQVFVHCDVVICDAKNPADEPCKRLCSRRGNKIKSQRRAVSDVHSFMHVSSGPVLISS